MKTSPNQPLETTPDSAIESASRFTSSARRVSARVSHMITPQQFLEAFLHEKVSVYAQANVQLAPVYAKYFGEPLSQRTRDFMLIDRVKAVIEDVEQSTDSATAITSEGWAKTDIRTRYHLARVGENWKIVRIDRQCLQCRISGRSQECQTCGGEGWYDSSKHVG